MSGADFPKQERLKSRKSIDQLVRTGARIHGKGLSLLWRITDKDCGQRVKVAFSIPKRKITKANQRNLMKRRLREAYRLNKSIVHEKALNDNICLEMMFVYQDIAPMKFDKARDKLVLLLTELCKNWREKYS
ncbi:MAG: ribonuclease P protein component [Vicingaceae bacterium]